MGCHALLRGIFLTQGSLASPALAGGFFTTSTTWETPIIYIRVYNYILLHGKLPQNVCSWNSKHLLSPFLSVGNLGVPPLGDSGWVSQEAAWLWPSQGSSLGDLLPSWLMWPLQASGLLRLLVRDINTLLYGPPYRSAHNRMLVYLRVGQRKREKVPQTEVIVFL